MSGDQHKSPPNVTVLPNSGLPRPTPAALYGRHQSSPVLPPLPLHPVAGTPEHHHFLSGLPFLTPGGSVPEVPPSSASSSLLQMALPFGGRLPLPIPPHPFDLHGSPPRSPADLISPSTDAAFTFAGLNGGRDADAAAMSLQSLLWHQYYQALLASQLTAAYRSTAADSSLFAPPVPPGLSLPGLDRRPLSPSPFRHPSDLSPTSPASLHSHLHHQQRLQHRFAPYPTPGSGSNSRRQQASPSSSSAADEVAMIDRRKSPSSGKMTVTSSGGGATRMTSANELRSIEKLVYGLQDSRRAAFYTDA